MLNILPMIQTGALLFGLVATLLARISGVDMISSIFRGVVVYGAITLAGLVFNYFYTKASMKVEKEAVEAIISKLKKEVEREKEMEKEKEKAKQERQN